MRASPMRPKNGGDVNAQAKSSKLISGATGEWEVVIGLEVHARIMSQSKLFSGASTAYGGDPNAHVSLVDAGMPGMLPVINEYCVEQAIRTGLGLNAKINTYSVFDRKNYFYPDLPQGYQISQYQYPIVGEGEIDVELEDGEVVTIGIERLHLEQDAGKSIHEERSKKSLVDLNRSGVALMEIVSKPDLRSAEEAGAYISKIRTIVQYLETCDGNMDEGSLKADVNVSVRKPGEPLGTRCEIKNVNSVRFIMQAIEYEANRQIDLLERGEEIEQQTRRFNSETGKTTKMRGKEDAHDYRYFPDPDLLPLEIEESRIEEIRQSLPELPDAKKRRFMTELGLSDYDAGVLTADKPSAEYFETVAQGRDPKLAANWIMGDLFGALNKADLEIEASPVKADQLGALLDLIGDQTISGKIAKQVFQIMFETGGDPVKIVEDQGLKQVTDTGAIEAEIDKIIAANPDQVAQVKEKPKAIGWFVGQVMQATGGKANPQAVNQILKEKLGLDG